MDVFSIAPEIKAMALATATPVEFGFEITSRCNFDCKMCYVHYQNSAELAKAELTTDQWIEIFDQAFSSGMMYALLTGGECFLRADFKQLYLHLWNKVQVSVNTNGSFITEEYISFFRTYRPRYIQISIYGHDDDSYYSVTGKRSFDSVKKAIQLLKRECIPVKLAVTISKYNFKDCRKIFELIHDLDLPYSIVSELIEPRSDVSNYDYSLTLDEYIHVQKVKREVFNKKAPVIPSNPLPDYGRDQDAVKNDIKRIRCKAGIYAAFISYKGILHPCASLTDIGVDVLKEGVSAAWMIVNKAAKEALVPNACAACPYDKVCNRCPSVRFYGLLTNQCNENHCRLIKRSCEEGLMVLK